MILNFADGIEIVIDEDRLVNWEQSNDKRYIVLTMKDGRGYRSFEFDVFKRTFIDSTGKK